jgi:hypothetical protein
MKHVTYQFLLGIVDSPVRRYTFRFFNLRSSLVMMAVLPLV